MCLIQLGCFGMSRSSLRVDRELGWAEILWCRSRSAEPDGLLDAMSATAKVMILVLSLLPAAAMAQSADGQDSAAPQGPLAPSSGRHHGRGHGAAEAPAGGSAPAAPLTPVVEPRQRLDAGAVLCATEDQLRQHQSAIKARLAGQPVGEPAGCHMVPEMVKVTVVLRDGLAATQVQLPGDPPATGWTDSMVRDQPAPSPR